MPTETEKPIAPATEAKEAPKEAPKDPPKPAPTPAEIEAGARSFMARMGFGVEEAEPPAKEEKTEKEPEPKAEDKPKEEPKEEAKAEPPKDEKKEEVKPKAADRIEFDKAPAQPDLVEEAAAKAAQKLSERFEKPKEPVQTAPVTTPSTLTPRQEKVLAVIKEIQENDPEYQAVPLVKQTTEFWQKEAAYRSNWEKENPGSKWNQRDAEHTEFYTANMPEYSDDAYQSAQERITEKRVQQVEERIGGEVKQLKHEQRKAQEMPRIKARVYQDMAVLAAQADPEIEKLVVKDGKPVLTPEVVQKMKETDPIAHRVLSIESTRLQAVVEEVESMYAFPDQFQFDANKTVQLPNGEVFHPHREIEQFYGQLEADLASRPANTTLREGKRFMPQAEYLAQQDRIIQTSKTRAEAESRLKTELDNKVWTLDARFIAQSYTDTTAEKVRKQIQEWRGYAKPNKVDASPTAPVEDSPVEETKPPVKKPSPPTVTTGSDKTNPGGALKQSIAERDAAIDKRMWGV